MGAQACNVLQALVLARLFFTARAFAPNVKVMLLIAMPSMRTAVHFAFVCDDS